MCPEEMYCHVPGDVLHRLQVWQPACCGRGYIPLVYVLTHSECCL